MRVFLIWWYKKNQKKRNAESEKCKKLTTNVPKKLIKAKYLTKVFSKQNFPKLELKIAALEKSNNF